MKKRSKILLSAVLTIALCLSLIAGSTFALFTSESKVNIAVTSGKVKVTAEITDPYVYSAEALDVAPTATESYYTENSAVVSDTIENGNYAGTYYYKSQAVTKITTGDNAGDFTGNFANLGTASYDASEQELTLDRVTPGDRVKFTVAIGNESNVAIQYRVVVNVRSGLKLYNALTVKIDGVKLNGVNKTGTWTALAPTADIADIPVEIFMPLFRIDGNDNDYQNLSTKIEIAVEAVQGNAKTTNDVLSTTVEATKTVAAEAITADNTVAEGDGITISDANNLLTVTLPESTKLTDSNTEIMVKAEPQDTVSTINILTDNANKASMSFDVSVLFVTTTVEDDVETITTTDAVAANNTEEITVKMFVGTGLTGVQLYHNSDPIESSKFSYDAATGYITFKTTGFSEYTVVYNADYLKETFDEDGKSTGIVVYEATETEGVYTTTKGGDDVYVTVVTNESTGETTEEVSTSIIVTGEDGVKFEKHIDGDLYICDMSDYTGTEYTVPENVTGLGQDSFKNNNTITKLILTSQIDSAYKALNGNSTISEVEFGSLTFIPNRMFYGCTGIKNLVIPATVTRIEDFAFYGNAAIETIIAEDVEYVGYKAFDACSALKILDIGGENVEIMGYAGRGLNSIEIIIIRGAKASVNLDYAPTGNSKGNYVFNKIEQTNNPGHLVGVKFYVANDTVAAQFSDELGNGQATRIIISCLKVSGVNGDVYFHGVDYDTDAALWADVISNIGSDKKIVVLSDTNIPATFVIPEGITLEGKVVNSVKPVLTITSSNGDGIKITNKDITIKNLTIDGTNITSDGYNSIINVEADGVIISDCMFINGGKSTWNSSILIERLTEDQTFIVKNCNIRGSFRGVLRESCNANIVIENCNIDAVYPFNIDGGNGGEITVKGGALHGWTSYSGVVAVTFDGTTFSKANSGYDCVAAYVDTNFVNCIFDTGFDVYAQTSGFDFNFTNCTKNGVIVTAENFKELFTDKDVWNKCVTTVDGVVVAVDQSENAE